MHRVEALSGIAPEHPPPSPIPAFAWRLVVSIAAAAVGLLLLVATRYGYHRDELYFLEASRHMAWASRAMRVPWVVAWPGLRHYD